MKVSYKLEIDNSEEIIKKKNDAIVRALEIIGQIVESQAAGLAPVDTGNLRNSITHNVDASNAIVYIGSNVEYAPYQEYGTYRMKAANGGRGFLRPAVEDNMAKIQSIFQEELSQ